MLGYGQSKRYKPVKDVQSKEKEFQEKFDTNISDDRPSVNLS